MQLERRRIRDRHFQIRKPRHHITWRPRFGEIEASRLGRIQDRSQVEAQLYLCMLSIGGFKVASPEPISKLSIRHCEEGLIDLRFFGAARAARLGRMDLLIFFMEKEEAAVNTITNEERTIIAGLPMSYQSKKKLIL